MKSKGKKRICTILCALLLAAVLAAPCGAAEAGSTDPAAGQAAAAQEPGQKEDTVVLKKVQKGYICEVNGKQVKNTWMTISGKGRYYFKKDGYAATLSTKIGGTYYVFNKKGQLQQPSATKVITIGKDKYRVTKSGKAKAGWYKKSGKKYYFDKTGKMVKGWSSNKKYYFDKKTGVMYTGIRVLANEKFYAFKSGGKYDAAKTKKLRSAAKSEKDISFLKKLLGNPKKKRYYDSCYAYKGQGGRDGVWTYQNFTVYTFRTDRGKEIYMGAASR